MHSGKIEGKRHKVWKYLTEILVKQKSTEELMREKRIQEVDGGFFERFGSLLREQSVRAEEEEKKESRRVAKAAATLIPDFFEKKEYVLNQERRESITSTDESIGDDDAFSSSDSETLDEDEEKRLAYFVKHLNVDELYSEILYVILHNVGSDKTIDNGTTALLSYVQEAFEMNDEKHKTILNEVQQRKSPELLLNVEVIEAKELMPKDSNGLSDPFVTLYLTSNPSRRYTTSVKTETLAPVWEEHFALPIADHTAEDYLFLEVWDFDAAETVKEKFGKMFKVKGLKGAKKLIKEIAITATAGEHANELVGTAKIPLQSIPSTGMTMWYRLDKKKKTNQRGVVKVHISFGSEKDSQVATQEHKHLLKTLLLYELKSTKANPFTWSGNFCPQAQEIITQHRVQSSLSRNDAALAAWIIYTYVHYDSPLHYVAFSNLLGHIVNHLNSPSTDEDEEKFFWESTKKLLPSCYSAIRKIRKKTVDQKQAMKLLVEILKILSKLSELTPHKDIELFPESSYRWLYSSAEGTDFQVQQALEHAVLSGGRDWYRYLMENNPKQDNTDEEALIHLNKIIQLIRTDLQKAVEFYDKIFQELANLQYAKLLYSFYQKELSILFESEIANVSKSLKQISYESSSINTNEASEPLSLGTKLFELYLALQRFVILGKGISPSDYESYEIKNFHRWFHGVVAQWLDIAVFKALQRIEKAVELDNLQPINDTVKYSTSALDTLTIFHQIKIFWDQLNWPDVEGSYTFVAKIIDDICRCCVFYADKIDSRVEGMGDMQDAYEKRFEVTKEWCTAINNIDFVCQSLKPFSEQLNSEGILQRLVDIRGPIEAQRCRDTLGNVLENSIDTVKNKIIDLLETVATKMKPAMKKLLIEGAELLHQDSNSIDKVMRYLDNNLATLHEELNPDNFERTLEIIWNYLGNILTDLIQSNIEKRRPPSFFANLRETLQLMVKSFKQSESETSDCETLKRIDYLLKLNGMETTQLIHQISIDRWTDQLNLGDSPYGELSVRLQFVKNDLKIEVINARNLIAMDSNGFSDSYVRIFMLPDEKFTTVPKPRTQTHSKNLFPLFDETFVVNLTPEQRRYPNALLLFSVRDKDFLGMSNQLIGEAYVNFKDISEDEGSITTLPQMRLVLGRPENLNSDAVKILENRQGDKLAKEFIKKYKMKIQPGRDKKE